MYIYIHTHTHTHTYTCMYFFEFPGGASGKEPTSQCRKHKRHGFDIWVGTIPWRRKWQATRAFLPGESHGQRGAWWGTVHAGLKSQPWLKRLSRHARIFQVHHFPWACCNNIWQIGLPTTAPLCKPAVWNLNVLQVTLTLWDFGTNLSSTFLSAGKCRKSLAFFGITPFI